MEKKKSLYANEIRLVNILKTIIDKKIIIVLIMFISILTSIGNNLLKKDTFEILLNIKPSKDTEFTSFLPIYSVTYDDFSLNSLQKKRLDSGERSKFLTSRDEISLVMLDKFLDELLDYEEFISVLSANANIAESIKGLSFEKERQLLYNYTKLLTLRKKANEGKYIYALNFIWHDRDEGVLILNDLLKLVKTNLEKRIFSNLGTLLEIKRRNNYDEDLVRIEFLKEQSLIAKELDIKDNQVDSVNLSQSSVSFNINTNNVAYYLRGFKTIDKEIKIIQNRQHVDVVNLEKDIKALKKTDIKWAYYNTNYISVKKLKSNFTSIVIIGIGFVISLLYIYIIVVFKSKKLIKRF